MKIIFLFIFLTSAPCWSAQSRQTLENTIIAHLGQSISSFSAPEAVLSKVGERLTSEEKSHLENLIKKKMWVEIPKVETQENTLKMTFSNGTTLNLEVVDYWSGQFKLNGYKLEMDRYPELLEQLSYLRRVIQSKVLSEQRSRAHNLFSILVPSSEASLTCNFAISSGCMEVSMATSLWLARTLSAESPLGRCQESYMKLNNAQKCVNDLKGSPTLVTLQEMGQALAKIPHTSLDITCNKGEGPTIWVDGVEVTRMNKGQSPSDYMLESSLNKGFQLSKLPEWAFQCCKKNSADPLSGTCEDFVNNHLGSPQKRREAFKSPDLRLNGKKLKGAQ